MMWKIKVILNQIIKYTLIMYLQKFFKTKYNLNLNYVTEYWNKQNTVEKKYDKIILVECMEELNVNWNTTYSFVPMLSKFYNAKVIALTSYSSYKETVKFISFFHKIDKIEPVYRVFDIKVKIQSFLILLKNMPFIYNSEYGFKIVVDNVDIGDLVYDEYLRIAKVETCKTTTFLFHLMTYNAIYQYLRYCDIVNRNCITDIVALRDTYSHSSFYRTKSNITIWKNIMTPSRVIIGKLESNKKFNYKPQYFQKKHLEYIKNKYTKNEIISIYNEIIDLRNRGKVKNSIDHREMALAHSNHDIETLEDFEKYYKVDKNKKTVVVYCHVFVDAVRYEHQPIFSDYYVWLTETIQFLVDNKNVNILVKPHPSEVLYNLGKTAKDVIIEFNNIHNTNIIFLEKKINVNIIYDISDIIITGSGTIGVEAPCLGHKVITAGSTMYENTDATFRSYSQEEYFKLIKNFEKLPNLTEIQKFNSMIGFIWINKLIYVQSNLYSSLDNEKTIEEKGRFLNNIYKNATEDDSLELFERIQNDSFN